MAPPFATSGTVRVTSGKIYGMATAIAAGILFASTTVALTTASAWAIVSLFDLPRWLAGPVETFAVASAVLIGVVTGWRAWQRERQVVGRIGSD